ncbi:MULTISPECIES: Na+/H+ antiporter subunit E [unclassified Alcanivorax]|jgi:multicomponent K+:H+ antiporter subunit E|uniref:Na+/H+ antiporter subunit E n=1 Tax=unclassified Alcanivorax TaxID=2638842 RepID=UPI000789F39A|nr:MULTISPECIES: Na+/H+ antiporter subunit E [unclassified Alcanivorax]KZX72258.1 cation:proton antiporter [Alcanivorax sp. HI0011]KZX77417.1 cation:proton antiporter [Alcanivorax sp. HI0013]KZY06732.1 cation:proton antiporter [Alcanivorax sp. HI0035]MEE2601822.1 Na+/H+ antiporter subunit E [Pseudomonadota bacterium]KZX60868.1 cation:proton antiporter [Alcanivorax sp. HI0003]|tara:strand:+ start:160 stop:645 length:486 start_codon:yes stop_codon:yes gene_type:complete
MKRLLPYPSLTLVLWLTWLLLNGFSVGHALLGLILAVVLPLGTRPFWPQVPLVRDRMGLLRFVLRVAKDILIANMAVAVKVLGPVKDLQPGFVEVPLDLRDRFAITVLTSTVSLTPGTVSADVSEDRTRLLVHALHVEDPAALVAEIKQRYEGPIKEIFEC